MIPATVQREETSEWADYTANETAGDESESIEDDEKGNKNLHKLGFNHFDEQEWARNTRREKMADEGGLRKKSTVERRCVDLHTAAYSFYVEGRFCLMFCDFLLWLFFTLFVFLFLFFQLDIRNSYGVHEAVYNRLILKRFPDEHNVTSITLRDIASVPEYWNWVKMVFLPEMFANIDWQPPQGIKISDQFYYTEFLKNKRVGLVSLHQERRKQRPTDKCSATGDSAKDSRKDDPWTSSFCLEKDQVDTSPTFKGAVRDTYRTRCGYANLANYCEETVDGCDSGGPPPSQPDQNTMYEVVFAEPSLGKQKVPRPCAYVIPVNQNMRKGIEDLEANQWVDFLTAYVTASAILFNPTRKIAVKVSVVVEFNEEGMVEPYKSKDTEYISGRHGGSHVAAFSPAQYDYRDRRRALQIMLGILIPCAVIIDIVRAYFFIQTGRSLFSFFSPTNTKGVSNIFRIANSVMAVVSIVMANSNQKEVDELTRQLETESVVRASSFKIKRDHLVVHSILFIMVVFQLIRSLRFNHSWSFLPNTLKKASGELFHFSVLFVIILLGYSFVGYYYYGTSILEFHRMDSALETMLQLAIGQGRLGYDDLVKPGLSVPFAVLFFWSFVVIVFFAMLNMFFAIILRAFDAASQEDTVGFVAVRSFFAKMIDPWGSLILKILSSENFMHRVEVVLSDYPLTTNTTFQLQNDQLSIDFTFLSAIDPVRTLMRTLFPKQQQESVEEVMSGFYVQLPIDWVVESYSTRALWMKSKHFLEGKCRCITNVGCAVFRVEAPKLKGDMTLMMIVRVRGEEFKTGPVQVCKTRNGSCVVAIRHQWSNVPIVPVEGRQTTAEELERSLSEHLQTLRYGTDFFARLYFIRARRQKPGMACKEVVEYCKRNFAHPLPITVNEGEELEMLRQGTSFGLAGIAAVIGAMLVIVYVASNANG